MDASTVAGCLGSNTQLKVLDLSWNNLGSKAGQELADALARNTCLRELSLDETSLGDSFAQAMARALAKNTDLTRLRCEIEAHIPPHCETTEHVDAQVAPVHVSMSAVRSLRYCGLGEAGQQVLQKAAACRLQPLELKL